MSEWTIWHNPRCSKSRRALELLRERSIEPTVIAYLETPPTAAELERVLAALAIEAGQLVRRGEAIFAELGLDDAATTPDQMISAMVSHPILIERPVVIRGARAVIGRPPERVFELISPDQGA